MVPVQAFFQAPPGLTDSDCCRSPTTWPIIRRRSVPARKCAAN